MTSDSASFDKARKSCSLPSSTVEYLKSWMMSPEHVAHPYPTDQEKAKMMQDTGIELKQLTNWFVNNRKRYWKPRVEARFQPKVSLKHPSVSTFLFNSGITPSPVVAKVDSTILSDVTKTGKNIQSLQVPEFVVQPLIQEKKYMLDDQSSISNCQSSTHESILSPSRTISSDQTTSFRLCSPVSIGSGCSSSSSNASFFSPTVKGENWYYPAFRRTSNEYCPPFDSTPKEARLISHHAYEVSVSTTSNHDSESFIDESFDTEENITKSSVSEIQRSVCVMVSSLPHNAKANECDNSVSDTYHGNANYIEPDEGYDEPAQKRFKISSDLYDLDHWKEACRNATHGYDNSLPSLEEATLLFGFTEKL